jgi:hypothetical protein
MNTTTTGTTIPPQLANLNRVGMVLGAVGILGCLAAFFGTVGQQTFMGITRRHFMESYLWAWVFVMIFALGCYGFMLMHHIVRGSWGKPVLRLFEAGAKMLPVMFILFLPIFLQRHELYPWAVDAKVRADETLQHRAAYMNETWFFFRTFAYFFIWSVITFLLCKWSKEQDETGDVALAQWRTNLSSIGFPIYIIMVTLAFTDWVMSLDAHWFSTIYGFWFVDFQGLASLAFVSLLATRQKLAKQPPYEELVDPQATRDWGNLLLTLVMVWAYFSLSQWLIIWSGNLPEEISFYLKRNAGTFAYLGAIDIIFSFFVPFLALLSGKSKGRPQLLAMVCILILVMRVYDSFWVVMPAMRQGGLVVYWTDGAALLAVFGLWLAGFGLLLKQNRLIPDHSYPVEPDEQEVLNHA